MEPKVTKKDLIEDLENFPIEVVEKMLEYQYKQNNIVDINVFIQDPSSDKAQNGFSWIKTPEGFDFWDQIIHDKNFDLFFKRYPKLSKNVYIRGDVDNGEEVIKELERRGGINHHDYSGNANELLYFIDPVTNYIVHASKLEKPLQNLLISNYTEITHSKKIIELTMEEIAEKLGVDAELLRIKK